jgi:hypothetical protein
MDNKGTAPAADGTAGTLHVPLASASSADFAMAQPVEHHWSVLAAILLIVAAVAWSLLRQRGARRR